MTTLHPASHLLYLVLGAPVAVVVALACVLAIGPVPERDDNQGSALRGADKTVVARAKFGRLRRVRR